MSGVIERNGKISFWCAIRKTEEKEGGGWVTICTVAIGIWHFEGNRTEESAFMAVGGKEVITIFIKSVSNLISWDIITTFAVISGLKEKHGAVSTILAAGNIELAKIKIAI